MTTLTGTQIQLMNIMANALFDRPIDLPGDVDWQALYKEANAQTVFPLVFSVVDSFIPERYKQRWEDRFNQILAKSINVSFEHSQLDELLSANGIPYAILKGVGSASYYPNPVLRSLGDVDFLIRPQDTETVDKLLEGVGFGEKKASKNGIHTEYKRKLKSDGFTSVWEMHSSVNSIPTSEIGDIIRGYLTDVIKDAVDYDDGNSTVKIPDDFHHGLILLLHTANHMTKEGIGLRHLCDWVMFANRFSDDEFRGLFEDKLKAAGLWHFAQLLTICGMKYLGCPSKEWVGITDDNLIDEMISDICNGGNFGNKDKDRALQTKYIFNSTQRTVDDKGIIKQVLITLDTKAREKRMFLPFGYVCVCIAFIAHVIEGGARLGNKETLVNAARRKRLYSEFGLFEPIGR